MLLPVFKYFSDLQLLPGGMCLKKRTLSSSSPVISYVKKRVFFKKLRLNIRFSPYVQSCRKILPYLNDTKFIMTQVCSWNGDISSSSYSTKISPYWLCYPEVYPEWINHSRGGQWWEGKWLFPVRVLEEVSTSGSHLRCSPSCQPLWKGPWIDRDAATVSPGGGERTSMDQHSKACIAAAHSKCASQDG